MFLGRLQQQTARCKLGTHSALSAVLLQGSIELKNLRVSCLSTEASNEKEIKRLFVHRLTDEQVKEAVANVHRSVRGNPVDSRRTYWFNVYKQVLHSSHLVLAVQNNNMSAREYTDFKNELKSKHIECLAVRNGVFGAACANAGLEGMRNLFQGPTLAIFSSASDTQAPNLIKDAAGILKKYTANTLLVGGHFDRFIFSSEKFDEIKSLPSKVQLFGELLGLLQYPGSTIAQILSQTPQVLAASLEQHQKQISEQETK